MQVRATLQRWLVLSLLALLASCAGMPRAVDLPRDRLVEALERRFPYQVRPAGLITVNVGMPRLTLLPEQNRVRLDFALDASERIVGGALRGGLTLSFAVRYEPSDATVRAVNVRIDDVGSPDLPPELRRPLQLIGALVGEGMLEGLVLHALRAEDLAQARGWTPGAIRVTPRGLRIELLPPVAGVQSMRTMADASYGKAGLANTVRALT